MKSPSHPPVQMLLPLAEPPTAKVELTRKHDLITVLAELLLFAASPVPDGRREVRDEAR